MLLKTDTYINVKIVKNKPMKERFSTFGYVPHIGRACHNMNIVQIYKRFPKESDCIKHLESLRWSNGVECVYCESDRTTPATKELRHHCNACNKSFCVTVGTIMHNTKLDLQKWFFAIALVVNAKKGLSSRQLGRDIEVTKNTAWYMLHRIRQAMQYDGGLLKGIVEIDESWIGGDDENKHKSKRSNATGYMHKTPVVAMVERGGKVKAKRIQKAIGSILKPLVKSEVSEDATIVTDGFGGYEGLNKHFSGHEKVNHTKNEYVRGIFHTNTVEGFFGLFKRGIFGQFHHLSDKYLDRYLDEFSFRYSNRKHENIFELVLQKAVQSNGVSYKELLRLG